jgi:peptidoglycan DL-endopeptidase RipA
MSNGEELFAFRDRTNSRPEFEVTRRGYDKRQVDDYLEQIDRQVAALSSERERAYAHVQDMSSKLQRVQAELTELQDRPPQVDRATFRDLGPTVDQILALAEHQAGEITTAAQQKAGDLLADAERVMTEARDQAAQTMRDLEEELAARRSEQDKVDEERRAVAQSHLDETQELAERLRADSEATLQHAQQEAEALRTHTQQELAQLRSEVEAEVADRRQALNQLQNELDAAQQRLSEWRQEQAEVEREVAQLEQRLEEVRQDRSQELERLDEARRAADSAERHAKAVRARVQREAQRVADLAAAAVLKAAERGTETGEYPMVVPVRRSHDVIDRAADNGTQTGEFPVVTPGQATAEKPSAEQLFAAPHDADTRRAAGEDYRADAGDSSPDDGIETGQFPVLVPAQRMPEQDANGAHGYAGDLAADQNGDQSVYQGGQSAYQAADHTVTQPIDRAVGRAFDEAAGRAGSGDGGAMAGQPPADPGNGGPEPPRVSMMVPMPGKPQNAEVSGGDHGLSNGPAGEGAGDQGAGDGGAGPPRYPMVLPSQPGPDHSRDGFAEPRGGYVPPGV